MNIIELLLKEFDQETAITRKMLERVPNDKWDWKPHEKSMSIQSLAVHIAELPGWVAMALHTEGLDFATMDYKPTQVQTAEELLKVFDESVAKGRQTLSNAKEEDLLPKWTMKTGDKVHAVFTKYEVIRHSLAQSIHHRAQLGVYLRLLNIPIPGTYGPSADENNF